MRPPDPLTVTCEATPSIGERAGPASVLDAGGLVGRYQVRRLLARGGMGRVYLARDTTLGRSVALKLVRAGSVDDFITEARITAHLNHPHIVQLHDVGRFGEHAFFALEYLEGESLRERMARDAPSRDESLRFLRAIADALRHAHAAGVFHCDLKPGNVMLPLDGRLRVVDFGLATVRAALPSAATPAGTPEWMAPEQWRGDAPSDRTDVWALAVLAYQLLGGEHPFGRADSVDARRRIVLDVTAAPAPPAAAFPEPLQALALRSLARDPLARPTAAEWYVALDAVLDGAAVAGGESPFRGLAAFDERHAGMFFGREAEIDAWLERMRELPAIPIVGPSGAGKSSFLLAGVIPRLRARGGWTIITVRPGADPFTALAHRLLAAVEDRPTPEATAALAAELLETPSLLALRLATIAAARGGHVLLAIDQLEELFTQGSDAREVEQFLALLAAVDDAAEPIRLAFTVRDDFVGRIGGIRNLFVITGLERDALRRTITGPLERLGYHFDDPALVDEMLAETTGGAADLPLLQFACRTLWEARDPQRRLLLESAYRAHGGVAGALARHADHVLAAMTPAEQAIARQLLLRLVVGNTRRIVEHERLLEDLPAAAAGVLDRLLAARLLVQQRPAGATTVAVELAHESLLVTWEQLRRWLEESGEDRRLLHELDEGATFWERRGARPADTWSEAETAATRVRIRQLQLALPARLERFLSAGEAHHLARRRRARRRRALVVGTALAITLVALFLADRFRDQKLEAESQAAALRLARGNTGRVELILQPFDWRDGPIPVAAAALSDLAITLHAPARDDFALPGAPIASELVDVRGTGAGHWLVDAPGGTAFVRIDGRGRAGERCAASWIRLRSLPGYSQRAARERIELPVPTCAASAAETVPIPAGPFVYGGPGAPPATLPPEELAPRETVSLDAYAIDRTEVSNARFAPFAALAAVHGFPAPVYPMAGALADIHRPEMPVTWVDAHQAAALCRYWGKRLPTEHEWTKAARGGLAVDGRPNPAPERLRPFAGDVRDCINAGGADDGHVWSARVDAFPCGASPYGVLNLAGNVAEWTARAGQTTPLRVIRGGDVEAPLELDHHSTVFRNTRPADHSDYAIGIRCVTDGDPAKGSQWLTH